ncbi:MAG: response regulator [Promethearchaeota archaeon]
MDLNDRMKDDPVKKNTEMIQFERETGLKAVWKGRITDSFRKWKAGEKIYIRDKERIGIYVSSREKEYWNSFVKKSKNKNFTMSKLIRMAIQMYIKLMPAFPTFESFVDYTRELKQPLTVIKGYSQLILETSKDQLDHEIYFNIKEIFEKCEYLENKINNTLESMNNSDAEAKRLQVHDILIVDDDKSTRIMLEAFFKGKGIDVVLASSASEADGILEEITPKIILLDVILPDMEGYIYCEKLKANRRFTRTPVYLISAVPENELAGSFKDHGADGYFPKPFNLEKLAKLKQKL